MDEDNFRKFQAFMKREGEAWQPTAAKKNKEAGSSSSVPQGKTGETQPAKIPTGTAKKPTAKEQGQKPSFATTVVRYWYNQDLKTALPVLYEKFNGCFKAIQSRDSRTANFWLTQIEKAVQEAKQRIDQQQKEQEQVKNLFLKLLQYSKTSQSEVLSKQTKDLFPGTSTTQKTLKDIFSELTCSDLINFRIQDVLELAHLLHLENEKIKELDSEIAVQNMIALYKQNLLEESRLLTFFQQLEETDILPLLEKEELILNKNDRPRILACFQDIPKYKVHIRKGLVHEVYINTNHPEEYSEFIPEICRAKIAEYSSRFQTLFMFRIWSIWEGRQYIKLFPSDQLWELHRVTEDPKHKTIKFNKKHFDEAQERYLAAKEFFEIAVEHATTEAHSVHESKTVLLFDWLSAFEESDTRIARTMQFLESLHLGKAGTLAQKTVLEAWQMEDNDPLAED